MKGKTKMINFKNEIAKKIAKVTNLNEKELETYIEEPKDTKNGDYAFPCFRLAKELKKAPPQIANEIKEKIEIDESITPKVEIAGGYLNFYINKELLAKEVIKEMAETYGRKEEDLKLNETLKKYLEQSMKEEKAIQFIVDNAKIK